MKKVLLQLVYFCLFICCFDVNAKNASDINTSVDIFTSITKAAEMQPFSVLVKMTPKNDWHIYWNNPGDAGVETKINVQSNNATVVLAKQSAPKHFFIHNLITQFAYDDAAYWLFDVIPNKNNNNDINLSFDVDWQECKDECVAVSVTKSITIPIAKENKINLDWENELFKAQKTFPIKNTTGYFKIKDNQLLINIPDITISDENINFIPEIKDAVVYNKEPVIQHNDNLLIIKQEIWEDVAFPETFNIILLENNQAYKISLSKSSNLKDIKNPIWGILLAAFIGGLILNLMPCIFPILFIKAMSLIENVYSYKRAWLEAIMYFIGVLVSFSLLALLLYLLRLNGDNIGWGFQLQSPYFIGFMFVLFFIIGLMFLDVININIPIFNSLATKKAQNHNINSFLTGLFAVLIASPCSAPFMGTAIGYSITQPLYVYFPIFIALATGYALPFTLISLFPQKIANHLPKPGRWMSILKKIFAIPVFATCIWLAWVFINQVNYDQNEKQNIIWHTFSEQNLEQDIKSDKPTLLVFTAKWCLTCLVNEKLVFETDEFAKIINNKKINLIKADWTSKNEQITDELNKYGRNSVPLYVLYNGNSAKPIILPQILTIKEIKKHFN